MKLSLLICSLNRRHDQLQFLLEVLKPQLTKDIEVVILLNNGEKTIGELRQSLLESAKGEYVCFIDDDDLVPNYYCEKILESLGEDYVGFKVKLFNDGVERLPSIHSLRYPGWFQDEHGYYRGVTHLNPIRRELALKGSFAEAQGAGEDEGWARQVRPFVKTEVFIDEFMYHYLHNTADSHFGSGTPAGEHEQKKLKYKGLRYI